MDGHLNLHDFPGTYSMLKEDWEMGFSMGDISQNPLIQQQGWAKLNGAVSPRCAVLATS